MSNDLKQAHFFQFAKTLEELKLAKGEPNPYCIDEALFVPNDDYMMFCEDMSPDYPFLAQMPADTYDVSSGILHVKLLTAEEPGSCLLLGKWHDVLFTAYLPAFQKELVNDVPCTHAPLEHPKVYINSAPFCFNAKDLVPHVRADRHNQTPIRFKVEKQIILSNIQFADYAMGSLRNDAIFLFDNKDLMWFDPAALCFHCLLIRTEQPSCGILVDAEGCSYGRYSAVVDDCSRLDLREAPVDRQYMSPPAPSHSDPER